MVQKMTLEKAKFRDYGDNSQEKELVIPSKWNEKDLAWLMDGAIKIRQPKKSSAIKQLAKIGYEKVLQEQKMVEIIANNERKNRQNSVDGLEQEIIKSWRK